MKEVWCYCGGTGYMPAYRENKVFMYVICPDCNGRGTLITEKETNENAR